MPDRTSLVRDEARLGSVTSRVSERADLGGKMVLVTGADSGLGRATAEAVADAGAHVILICRSATAGAQLRSALLRRSAEVRLETVDLSSQSSVRALSGRLASLLDRVDVLINNAGVCVWRRHTTPDGFERTFATNYLGHFQLTCALLDQLRAGRAHVVNVSSTYSRRADLRRAELVDIARGRAWRGGLQAYSDSKLANRWFTFEIFRRHGHKGITSNAFHPGILGTSILHRNMGPIGWATRLARPFLPGPEASARALLGLISRSERERPNARFFCREKDSARATWASDEALARQLWDLSETWTQQAD